MTEPLIPFKNYPEFRDLAPPKEQQNAISDPHELNLEFNED